MAYFSNSSQGMCFDEQCMKCIFGKKSCPIANVQMVFNYKAAGNETASEILNDLVKNDGTCVMFDEFENELATPEYERKQIDLL